VLIPFFGCAEAADPAAAFKSISVASLTENARVGHLAAFPLAAEGWPPHKCKWHKEPHLINCKNLAVGFLHFAQFPQEIPVAQKENSGAFNACFSLHGRSSIVIPYCGDCVLFPAAAEVVPKAYLPTEAGCSFNDAFWCSAGTFSMQDATRKKKDA
jgi:hypothetical protein